MEENKKKEDIRGMVIGGGFMLGLGAGFFLLKLSVLYFIGSILAGIGIGLLVSGFIPKD